MARREDAIVPGRGPRERLADHATIDRLAAELLPALVAQLGESGLGELEVREGPWRLRLRMPAEDGLRLRMPADAAAGARATAGSAAGDPAHVQLTLPDPATAASVAAASGVDSAAHEAPPGTGPSGETAAGAPNPTAAPAAGEGGPAAPRIVATSPAVGFFHPRPALAEGSTLKAGAVLGSVDVLGVAQEVTAPAAGIVARFLVEPGEPVEYGQEILEIGQQRAAVAPPEPSARSEAGARPETSAQPPAADEPPSAVALPAPDGPPAADEPPTAVALPAPDGPPAADEPPVPGAPEPRPSAGGTPAPATSANPGFGAAPELEGDA